MSTEAETNARVERIPADAAGERLTAPEAAASTAPAAPTAVPRVVRNGATRDRDANVLVTSIQAWAHYASTALPAKLRSLRVATSGDGRVLVSGTPLPPLAGRRYVEREGVALPSGYAFSPAIDGVALRTLLGNPPDALALFHEDGTCEQIDASEFGAADHALHGRRST